MRSKKILFVLTLLTAGLVSTSADAITCGQIFQKAKRLPKGSMTRASCVFETQHPGEIRGSFISYYRCDGGTRYKLTTYEDLSCEAKPAKKDE